ncbi:hypothetical protein ACTJJB_25460 [Chitinophaga sp. 22536]|uniref:hypothetical protein n=1 Tax=unclassified Chitinophaga TaxID=2619133 RepID=UPI003F827254
MNKIKVAFAALTAVVGIGGAYAATHHQVSANRAVTVYNWRTVLPNGPILFSATIATAKSLRNCNGVTLFCLQGTAFSSSTPTPVVTLLKKQ